MRRRMNKIMAAMLIGAMTASLALTGCGGKKSASKDGKKELTVWAWDVALMQLEEAAEEYQKDHPDVTFKFEEMGTDQIYKKLSTSLATGNGIADIIAIEGDVLVGYADKFPEGFLDVSDAINTDDFLASKIGEVSYKDKIHAFPWDAGPAAMFYRTDYFEQAGVNPEDIQTWDDLIEAGKKIEASCKTPSGDPVKMIPVDPKKSSLYSMIRGEFGIGVFDQTWSSSSRPDLKRGLRIYGRNQERQHPQGSAWRGCRKAEDGRSESGYHQRSQDCRNQFW